MNCFPPGICFKNYGNNKARKHFILWDCNQWITKKHLTCGCLASVINGSSSRYTSNVLKKPFLFLHQQLLGRQLFLEFIFLLLCLYIKYTKGKKSQVNTNWNHDKNLDSFIFSWWRFSKYYIIGQRTFTYKSTQNI